MVIRRFHFCAEHLAGPLNCSASAARIKLAAAAREERAGGCAYDLGSLVAAAVIALLGCPGIGQ